MASKKQVIALAREHGFTQDPDPGLICFRRTHPDGRQQMLRVFWWSNKKFAATLGIPNAYIVVCPGIDQDHHEDGRFRLPLVEWPSSEQLRRSPHEVLEEFRNVFIKALDAPSAQAHEAFQGLGGRYRL